MMLSFMIQICHYNNMTTKKEEGRGVKVAATSEKTEKNAFKLPMVTFTPC